MSRRQITAKSAGEWAAVLPTYVGLLILVLSFLLFAGTALVSGHGGVVSPAILAAAGALITVGQSADVAVSLRKAAIEASAPPPSSDPPEGAS